MNPWEITSAVCDDSALPRDDILDDISLDIRQAEIMGCKSTTVKPPDLTTEKIESNYGVVSYRLGLW